MVHLEKLTVLQLVKKFAILWNQKFHYCVHNTHQFLELDEYNPCHPVFLKTHFNII